MDDIKRYTIVCTTDAEEGIFSKAEYIEKAHHDGHLAYMWYERLKSQIQKDLSFFPYKYQVYPAGAWAEKGIREYLLRNDIVFYSVDEQNAAVIIHAVFTRGKNISEDLAEN